MKLTNEKYYLHNKSLLHIVPWHQLLEFLPYLIVENMSLDKVKNYVLLFKFKDFVHLKQHIYVPLATKGLMLKKI